MKIVTDEELSAHNQMVALGGLKGGIAGTVISTLMFTFGKKRYPAIGKLPIAFKTALKIAPPTFGAIVVAELGSLNFDKTMYHGDDLQTQRNLEEMRRWRSLPIQDKIVESLSSHKYKIIVGAWAASMYGSWVFVDRDPIMTKAQKIVQARVYAQFLTVGLLLASIGLNVYEEKKEKEGNNKKQAHRVLEDSWKDIVAQEEEDELKLLNEKKTAKTNNGKSTAAL